MNNTLEIPLLIVFFVISVRFVGAVLLLNIIYRMIQEFKINRSEFKTTRLLLLMLGATYTVSSVLSLLVSSCYLLDGCFDNSIISSYSAVGAINSFMAILILYIIYNSKEN